MAFDKRPFLCNIGNYFEFLVVQKSCAKNVHALLYYYPLVKKYRYLYRKFLVKQRKYCAIVVIVLNLI